jgi:RNA polymerase sigma-70 factor (ECF subfamily)
MECHDEDEPMVVTRPSADCRADAAILAESYRRPERFADLFDAYHGEIYRYVASRLSIGSADDLAAETFLVAFRRRATFTGPDAHVRAWLYGIATNLIRRHRRTEERRYRALDRVGARDGTAAGDDHDERVVDRVVAQSVQGDLAAALVSLKPRDRDVLLLTALGGLSYSEVATALDIPEGTVASRLYRARRTVRAALGGTDPTRDPSGER